MEKKNSRRLEKGCVSAKFRTESSTDNTTAGANHLKSITAVYYTCENCVPRRRSQLGICALWRQKLGKIGKNGSIFGTCFHPLTPRFGRDPSTIATLNAMSVVGGQVILAYVGVCTVFGVSKVLSSRLLKIEKMGSIFGACFRPHAPRFGRDSQLKYRYWDVKV